MRRGYHSTVKLARPDVRHPRVVLAGCRAFVDGDGDDAGLVPALRTRGLHARWLAWDDPETLEADLVIPRATWDYTERLDEFLAWTRRVRNLVNAPAIVAWNTDKRYLADLYAAGVPDRAKHVLRAGGAGARPDGRGRGQAVDWSGIGWCTTVHRRRSGAPPCDRVHADGHTALVQPYDPRIAEGETALVFLGGEQSHAFNKGPLLPPPGELAVLDESGTYAAETLRPAEPDIELWQVGHEALAAAAAKLGIGVDELLYARVDVIGGAEDPRLLELELVEPSLGWRQLDEDTRGTQQREFARRRRVSPRAARARTPREWTAVASTPIAPTSPRCRWQPPRRGRRPGRRAHR